MSIQPLPDPVPGDYLMQFGSDTEENRIEAEKTLRANGCKRFRPEIAHDGSMRVHGYLSE